MKPIESFFEGQRAIYTLRQKTFLHGMPSTEGEYGSSLVIRGFHVTIDFL